MSDDLSTQDRRITKTDFRLCLTCTSRSQASFCLYTLRSISIRSEETFVRLRYLLGGDRPSQTAHLGVSSSRITEKSENPSFKRVVSHERLQRSHKTFFNASHLYCASKDQIQSQDAVKLHRVFLSRCRKSASSQTGLFHRASLRDSVQIVTPFVRVGTYPTRNFATLGPLLLRPPFTGASVISFAYANQRL